MAIAETARESQVAEIVRPAVLLRDNVVDPKAQA
jgi:hypothetical protein